MHAAGRRFVDSYRAARVTLGVPVSGVVAVTAALGALAVAAVVFGAATEDVTQHNGLAHSDPAHLRFFIDHRSAALDHVARLVTNAGTVAVLAGVAAIAAVLLWYRGLRVALAIAPAVSLGIAAIATAATKALVDRSRPPVALHLVRESDASFPSGHATNSAAVFMTIAFIAAVYEFRRPITRTISVLIGALLTGSVGISRLILGVHWPTDVLAGWALGLTIALAVTITFSLLARVVPRQPRDEERLPRRATLRIQSLLYRQRQARLLNAA